MEPKKYLLIERDNIIFLNVEKCTYEQFTVDNILSVETEIPLTFFNFHETSCISLQIPKQMYRRT